MVQRKHIGQLIKGTTEPYFNHLAAVGEMAKPLTKFGYEIGLCHDLLEDTSTTKNELMQAMISFKYPESDARYITACVVELTDVFTAFNYPNLSKNIRKEKEAERMLTISPAAQTVKYCDLIDNVKWVLLHDQKHAKQYLQKKRQLLLDMVYGDNCMRQRVLDLIDNALSLPK